MLWPTLHLRIARDVHVKKVRKALTIRTLRNDVPVRRATWPPDWE
jgi:hypothetical protein